MNIELFKKNISAARKVISEKKEFIRQTESDIAKHLCPFAIGDEVLSPNGEKEIVASISYCGWSIVGYDFMVFKLKKDGEPYKQSTHAYGNYKKYVEAT